MKFSKEIEVFNPPLASVASSGPWIHSVFAFTLSWPRKTLFKRDSAVTYRLVSDMFISFKNISEVIKKPVWTTWVENVTGFCSSSKKHLFFLFH